MLNRLIPIIVTIIVIGFIGCGEDNGVGPEGEEPPTIPEVQNAQPDLSYFNGATAPSGDTAFVQAQGQIGSARLLLSMGQVYSGYLQTAQSENANYEDGTWRWNYSDSYNGMSMNIEVTAQKKDNATDWAMFWTFDDGAGNSVENYRIIEGQVRNDGSEGEWTFNTLTENNEETPAYTSNWSIISETQQTITLDVYEQGSSVATILYEKNDPEFTMTYDFQGEQENIVLFWNTTSGRGYMSQGGERQCWGENFQDVPCS